MHNYYKALLDGLGETVPNHTYAAAFTMAIAMGAVIVSGLLFAPYEPQKVAEKIKQKIAHVMDIHQRERIYRPLLPIPVSQGAKMPDMDYGNYIAGIERVQEARTDVQITPRETERAEVFSRLKRSEWHWAMLKNSLKEPVPPKQKPPVVIPPSMIVGSAN